MGKVDIATKQYMSHRDIIADAFNFYIYDGEQVVIQPDRLQKIDTAKISDEEYDRFKTDLGAVMQFIKHQSDEDGSWIKGKTRFEHVEKEAVELINLITGSKIIGDEKEEEVNMCRAWENSINNAKSEGRLEGRLDGKREGEIEGKIEAYNDCNMPIAEIAKKVSKPEECVKEVIKKLSAACL